MTKTIKLPDNFIAKEDGEKLESFGGHPIGRGRATRWHWAHDANGDDVFEIFRGGVNEEPAARIRRDREQDALRVDDHSEQAICTGALEHVLAELENCCARLHSEGPGYCGSVHPATGRRCARTLPPNHGAAAASVRSRLRDFRQL